MEPVVTTRAIVIRTSVAAFLACVGIVSAFAARDVLAWRGQTAHADVAIASFSPDLSVWRPHTWLPAGASEWLVGAGDDVAFGQALQHFQVFRGHQQWGLFVAGGVTWGGLRYYLFKPAQRPSFTGPLPAKSAARDDYGALKDAA